MRTLKKTLALVLVLAMALSLVVIGANAAFTDVTADTDYAEAIDVMSGIGVINGMTATTFAPDGSLTREQAAKIVCYMMLGPTNAQLVSNATASTFTDVAADRWSAGYIEYCANIGIINGVGDNKFAPEDTLTTAAFTKMLLCAVGYKADVEGFTGASWAINVASTAVTAGVYDSDITISASTTITRAQACQLAFKALTAKTVQYTGGSTMTVNGVTITTGAARSYVGHETASGYLAGTGATNDEYAQFCETHFSTLKLYSVSDTTDAFGRPAHKWMKSTTTIGTYPDTAIMTYTTAVTGKALYTDVMNAGYTFDTTVPVVRNGGTANAYDVATFAASTTAEGGNGTAIEVYANTTTGVVTKIVVVATYLATATITTADVASTTSVDESVLTLSFINEGNAQALTVAATAKVPGYAAAFAAAKAAATAGTTAYVLVTPKGDNSASTTSLTLAIPESATLTATSYTGSTFTAGGTTYKYSDTIADAQKVTVFTAITAYFDSYGYVIGTNSVASTASYAYVVALGQTTDGFSNVYQAKLLYTDGTVGVVTTAADYTQTTSNTLGVNLAGQIVTYSVNSAGKTVLTPAAATTVVSSTALTLKTGNPAYTWGTSRVADSTTVFLVKTTDSAGTITYAAYTGIASVPSYAGAVATAGAVYTKTSGVSAVVFLDNPTYSGTATTTDKIFVSGIETEVHTSATTSYFVANAVVNGVATTLNLAGDHNIGVYTTMTTNASGYVTLTNNVSSSISSAAITAASNGVLKIGSGSFGYTSDCVVYFYDGTTGALTASTIAGITTGTYTGVYTTDTSGLITGIYLTEVA